MLNRISVLIDFDNLPKPPNEKVNIYKSIITIAASIIFLLLLLLSPEIFSFKINNEYLEFFNTDMINKSFLFPVIFIFMLVSRETIKMFSNTLNKKTAALFIGIDVVSAIASSLWLLLYDIINIDFINVLIKLERGNSIAFKIFSNFQSFCLLCILFALLLDSVYVLIKLKEINKI